MEERATRTRSRSTHGRTPKSRRKESPLPLSLRVEKNVICLLLGRRVIKTVVRRTAGKHGAHLVDLVYKLARIALGKRETKKMVKRTLNVIAEISVLTMHGKLSPNQLDAMRHALLVPLQKFQRMMEAELDNAQNATTRIRSTYLSIEQSDHYRTSFIRSVRKAEKALFLTLAPLIQERTLYRFVKVVRALRDPQIVTTCLGENRICPTATPTATTPPSTGVSSLLKEILGTIDRMAEEQKEWCIKKSKSRRRRRGRRTAVRSCSQY